MESMFATAGLAIVAFAATNIDDLFLLAALLSSPSWPQREVVLGQFLGIGILFAASVAAATMSVLIPHEYIGLLGILPIVIGIRQLLRRTEGQETYEEVVPRAGIFSVAAITIANGGDNLGVYIPVFAVRPAAEIVVFGAVFIVITGVWCATAMWMIRRPGVGELLRRCGSRTLPFVLIALGMIVMGEAGTFGGFL